MIKLRGEEKVDRHKQKESVCIVCEKEKRNGYYLYDSFICLDCEKKIITTEPDEPLYFFYVQQLKKIGKRSIRQYENLINFK